MHCTLRTDNFQNLEFFYHNIHWFLSASINQTISISKTKENKTEKMAFHVDFSAKNVLKFNFGLLLAQKPKQQEGAFPSLGNNVFPEPG